MEIFFTIVAGLTGLILGVLATRARLAAKHSELKAQLEGQVVALTERLSQKESALLECESSLKACEVEKAKLNDALTTTKVELAQATTRAERTESIELENATLSAENTRLKEVLASEAAKRSAAEQATQEKLALISKTETQIQETFQALSAKVLKDSTESLLSVAKTTFEGYQQSSLVDLDARQKAINELVTPISDALKEIEANRQSTTASLAEQIKAMNEGYVSLRAETSRLVQALKTPVARGKWGEVQLRRVVEFTGMIKHCDFEEQESKNTETGKLRPDMTVKLPNGRNIVVDAKVPLAAYLDAIECEDDSVRAIKLKAHAAQVRAHVDNLSRKEYWAQFQPTPDFVFLFVPGESIYSAALQADPTLIEYAATSRVIIASPTSLITLLQVVAHGWREAQITENSNRIAIIGKELYERICTFADHYSSLRGAIDNTVKHFNKTVGSLEGMILPSARKIKELGVTSGSEVEVLEPVESIPRPLKAAELMLSAPLEAAAEVQIQ